MHDRNVPRRSAQDLIGVSNALAALGGEAMASAEPKLVVEIGAFGPSRRGGLSAQTKYRVTYYRLPASPSSNSP
jgi:hypothetical protein